MSGFFDIVSIKIFFISAILFFVGYSFAPTAYYKKIRWLLWYPFFIISLIDKYFKKNMAAPLIFLILFFLNSVSLFINLLSAYGVILPYIFCIYLGLNIGIVMYHSLDGKFYYVSLLNPVALFELPAAWLSLTMAIQLSLTRYFDSNQVPLLSFDQYLHYFFILILPLLIIAGLVETIMIVKARKLEENNKK